MDGSKDGQAGAPVAVTVSRGPTAPAVGRTGAQRGREGRPATTPTTVSAGVPTAAAASKGPTVYAVGPAGMLTSAAGKRRPAGKWPTTVPTVVPAGAPTVVAAAKEPTAPAGVLALAVTKGGLAEGWGRVVAMAAAKSDGATLEAAESMATVLWSKTEGVAMTKVRLRWTGLAWCSRPRRAVLGPEPDRPGAEPGQTTSPRLDLGRIQAAGPTGCHTRLKQLSRSGPGQSRGAGIGSKTGWAEEAEPTWD
jgi:hypothetical protein